MFFFSALVLDADARKVINNQRGQGESKRCSCNVISASNQACGNSAETPHTPKTAII